MGACENAACMSMEEYANDAALLDENVDQASIAKGSLDEAAIVIPRKYGDTKEEQNEYDY